MRLCLPVFVDDLVLRLLKHLLQNSGQPPFALWHKKQKGGHGQGIPEKGTTYFCLEDTEILTNHILTI